MPWHPKTASTTAPNATERQPFLDNIVTDLRRVRLSNDPTKWEFSGSVTDTKVALAFELLDYFTSRGGALDRMSAFAVAIRGKADITCCTAYVRF